MKSLVIFVLILLTNSVATADGPSVDETGITLNHSTQPGPPADRYEILFIGNSHSSLNDLPGLVSTLIETGITDSNALTTTAPGWGFLADRLNDGATLKSLNSRPWTHVILQAQKYSSSGNYTYPTQAAEEWIRRVKARNGLPVLFPEWPRRGNTEEGPRVHNLHLGIAAREPACVAPIGLAWEESIAHYPELALHAFDGNHSNRTGALLTAFVFYQVITLQDASGLPYIPEIDIDAQVQQNLRGIASSVVKQNQAYCIAAGLRVNPEEIAFQVGSNGESTHRVVTLSNSGTLPLTLDSIVAPEEPFVLELGTCAPQPLTLEPMGSCTLTLKFEPHFEGHFFDSIEFNSAALNSSLIVSLNGFHGPIVPTLNRWGILLLALLLVGSAAILRK